MTSSTRTFPLFGPRRSGWPPLTKVNSSTPSVPTSSPDSGRSPKRNDGEVITIRSTTAPDPGHPSPQEKANRSATPQRRPGPRSTGRSEAPPPPGRESPKRPKPSQANTARSQPLATPRCGGDDWMNHQRSPRLLCLHLHAPCNPCEWLFDPTWSAVNLTSLFNKLEITNQSGKVGWPVAADGETRTLRRSVLCECSDDERASWCECLPKHRHIRGLILLVG